MIDIKTYASGSKSNCYCLQYNNKRLMLEAGLTIAEIKKAFNFDLNVEGCLVTHSHLDHARSVSDLAKIGIDCFLTKETSEALNLDEILWNSSHRINIIEPLRQFKIDEFNILPFETEHDCSGSAGFLIQAGENKILFATDTYYLKYKFNGLTHIMIECNFCPDILDYNIKHGLTPSVIRKRLLKSHFSLQNVITFFQENDLNQLKEVHLIHVSEGNGDKELFKKEIQKLTGVPVYVF